MNSIKWKKILLVALTSVGVLVVAAGSYGWHKITATFTNIQEEIERQETESRLATIDFEEGDPFSVLLMGVDEPGGEDDPYQRSDALILLTVNPERNSTQMVSIPRDTYTELIGKGEKDKINHAYAFGGTQMTIRTVENFMDIPVDYFVRVDLEGLEDMVNAVDGIEVNNHIEFTHGDIHFEEGPIQLNGEETIIYTTMRSEDPRGDLGRTERQRKVITGILHQGASFSSITRVEEILGAVEDNVRTSFSLREIWDIQSNYRDALDEIKQHEIEGEDGEIDEVYYYMPDEEAVNQLSNVLQEHLELDDPEEEQVLD